MIMNDADAARRIGQRLRNARLAAGLTMEQLADRADLSIPTVSSAEHGSRQPRLGTLHKLAAALNIPVGTLLVDPAIPPSSVHDTTRTQQPSADNDRDPGTDVSAGNHVAPADTATDTDTDITRGTGMEPDWGIDPASGAAGVAEAGGLTH